MNYWTEWEEGVAFDIFDDWTSTLEIGDSGVETYADYKANAVNAHGLHKLGNGTVIPNDFNIFISILPIDLAEGDTFSFYIDPPNGLRKTNPISIGSSSLPIESISTTGESFYLGDSHLQDSKTNKGGFRVASSSIEMVEQTEVIDDWTQPTHNNPFDPTQLGVSGIMGLIGQAVPGLSTISNVVSGLFGPATTYTGYNPKSTKDSNDNGNDNELIRKKIIPIGDLTPLTSRQIYNQNPNQYTLRTR